MSKKEEILKEINISGGISPKDLSIKVGISRVEIHKHLKKLLEEKLIEKIGKGPGVKYKRHILSADDVIEKNFIHITPSGDRIDGVRAFEVWSAGNLKKFSYLEKKEKYLETFLQNEASKVNGVFDLSSKIEEFTLPSVDKLFFVEFFTYEDFGLTKLSRLFHTAKSNSNLKIMEEILSEVKDIVNNFVKKEKFDNILFVPPTARREYQIMDFYKEKLIENKKIPLIAIEKKDKEYTPQQKHLKTKEERIANAEETFDIDSNTVRGSNILIIDDMVGSGSTINEIAKKIKKVNPKSKVTGLSIIGVKKGFVVEKSV